MLVHMQNNIRDRNIQKQRAEERCMSTSTLLFSSADQVFCTSCSLGARERARSAHRRRRVVAIPPSFDRRWGGRPSQRRTRLHGLIRLLRVRIRLEVFRLALLSAITHNHNIPSVAMYPDRNQL